MKDRGSMNNKRSAILALATVLAATSALAAPPRRAPVVILSLDGLSPDYVLDADRYGLKIPHLRRALAEGTHASGAIGVLPTVTYASHTTLVTGVSPARHGILYNTTFDPLGRNLGGWYWYAEDIRVPTLWDAARQAGLVTSSVDWPVTVGAAITHNIVQYWRTDEPDAPDDAKLARVLSTPGLLAEAERELGRYPSGYAFDVAADRRRAAFNAWLIETRRPALHLGYLSGLDEELHLSGPGSPQGLAVLEQLDEMVGSIWKAAAKASGNQAVLAIVSDHGHVRVTRELRLNELLRRAGLILLDQRGKVTDWQAVAWGTGGSAAVMLKDPADAGLRQRVASILEPLAARADSPIERLLDGGQARSFGGYPEAVFVVAVKPDVSISDVMEDPAFGPILPVGEHGHLPEHREMDAAFFAVGPGVPAGRDLGRIDMRDIAPTLAGLLGVALPQSEGRDLLAPGGR